MQCPLIHTKPLPHVLMSGEGEDEGGNAGEGADQGGDYGEAGGNEEETNEGFYFW